MVNKIIVPVSKFQAKDGKVFHDELSAIHHEKLLDGEIKIFEKSCVTLVTTDGYQSFYFDRLNLV